MQHPTGQRRARNGRESAKQSPTLPELLFQRRGWARILFIKHSCLWFRTFFLACSLNTSRLPLIALVFRIEVQQGVIATETKKFTQDSALSRAVGVASWQSHLRSKCIQQTKEQPLARPRTPHQTQVIQSLGGPPPIPLSIIYSVNIILSLTYEQTRSKLI